VAGAAAQLPEQPGVDGAEKSPFLAHGGGDGGLILDQPDDLGGGKIGGQGQTGGSAIALPAAIGGQAGDDAVGAHVLPDQSVVEGGAAGAIPHHGSLALIGDADGRQIGGSQARRCHRLPDDQAAVLPDLERIVFHPTGLGIVLAMLALRRGDDAPEPVEDDKPGGGCALVERTDKSAHGFPPAALIGPAPR